MGWADETPETLLAIRANLLRGLELVAEHVNAGTFHRIGPKGEAPPSQSGHLTRIFLESIDAELSRRENGEQPRCPS
jgi:hypothetical protein